MTSFPTATSPRKSDLAISLLRTPLGVLLGVVVVGFVLGACGNRTTIDVGSSSGSAFPAASAPGEGTTVFAEEYPPGAPAVEPEPPTTLADLTAPLGSAQANLDQVSAHIELDAVGPRPRSISIPSIGVENAAVTAVGVETNGDMEIPPAEQVGWYRYGPRPGEAGSAVIAGHIAYNGVNGVFRYLADLEVGTTFTLTFTNDTSADYLVTDLQTYLKTELPRDELFDRSGPPRLVLVTCGGSFNYDASSYESNVVAYAVPI